MNGPSSFDPQEARLPTPNGSQIRLGEGGSLSGKGVDDRLVVLDSDVQAAQICEATVESLHTRLDDVEDAMWRAIESNVLSYRMLGEQAVRDVRATTRLAARLFLTCVAEGRRLTADERAEVIAAGLERAHQGVPLEANRSAIRSAADEAWQVIRDIVLSQFPSDAVAGAAAMFAALAAFVEDFGAAMAEGYRLYNDAREGHGGAFVDSLLDGTIVEQAQIAKAAGYRLDEECWLVVARRVAPHAGAPGDGAPLLDSVFAPGDAPLARCMQQREPIEHGVLVFPDRCVPTAAFLGGLGETARKEGFVAVVERASDLAAVAPRYALMRDLLPAIAAARPPPGLIEVEEVLPWALLRSAQEPLAIETVRCALDPIPTLPAEDAAELVAVLRETLVLGKTAEEAARVLGMSASTVYRRRKAFKKLTGRSLQDRWDVLLITQAIQLLDLGNLPSLGGLAWEPSR